MTCETCARFLAMADDAQRAAEMPDHEADEERILDDLNRHYIAHHDVLQRHALVLLETMRPFPVRNSLPKFVETERHFGRVTYELDRRADQFREDEQVQLWVPTWVKVVTDYFSDLRFDCGSAEMADALDYSRNKILWKAAREDVWLQYAIDSAFRLGGRDAAMAIVEVDPNPLDTYRARRMIGETAASQSAKRM